MTHALPAHIATGIDEKDAERGWPRLSTSAGFAQDARLSQFLSSLLVRARLLKEVVEHGSPEDKLLNEVRREIESFDVCDMGSAYWKTCAWGEAFRIELLLLMAEPAGCMVGELDYRLAVADSIGARNIKCLKAERAKLPPGISEEIKQDKHLRCEVKMLLLETVKATQWQLTKKYLSRKLLKLATRNIVFAAMASFLLFIIPYICIIVDFYLTDDKGKVDVTIHQWVGLPLLTCLSAGLFGSYFSRLLYIQKNSISLTYDELVSTQDKIAITLRGAVGICGAALLYFFLHSGVITGSLVPDINNLSIEIIKQQMYPRLLIANKDLALLVIWGFFAGFSERLLPSILARTEASLTTSRGQADNTPRVRMDHPLADT